MNPTLSAVAPVAPIGADALLVLLLQLGLLMSMAFALGRLAVRLGMPALVGELSAGIILGPSLLAHLSPDAMAWLLRPEAAQLHLLDAVGQVGVLLLVGLTGAHLDLNLVRRRGLTAVRISFAGFAVPLGFGVLTGLVLPGWLVPETADRSTFVLFLGVAMGVSAIPVIAKTLMEMRLLHRNVGQLTLTAVMIDDIIGWMMLAVVSAMATTGVRAGTILVSLGAVALVAVTAVLLRPAVRVALRFTDRTDRSQAAAGTTVALVATLFLLAAAGTQALHLEAVFGAFVCGIMIRSCGVLEPARVAPLRTTVLSFLAPVFFATTGLRMDLTLLADPAVLLTGVAVLAVAVVGKFVGAYVGARLSRLTHWEGLAIGAGMNARGVIEVIIAMVGLRLGVLGPEMYTIIVLVAVVTSLMAPPILRATMNRVEETAEEQLRADLHESSPSVTPAEGPAEPPVGGGRAG
ncbi:cation:proton antiporter [Micromonospora sp. NPDC047793]|uniref:cation:proton antiporter n=1 Tax=unclassified Micromonospora TaxID=2617518 RepID=UPI0026C3867B